MRDLKGIKIINKEGVILTVETNLSEFCRIHSFCYVAIHLMIRGKRPFYKGWVLYRDGITPEEITNTIQSKSHHKGTKIVFPTGEVLEITSTLRRFCKDHALCYNSMNDVVCERRNNYKGIHLLGTDLIDGRKIAAPLLSKKLSKGTQEFINQAKAKYGDKFDYSCVTYTNSRTRVIIKCHVHGEFEQTPSAHLNSRRGCYGCWVDDRGNLRRDSQDDFISKAIEKHGDKYDYSFVEYKESQSKVRIICLKHNIGFLQRPNRHLQGDGCPRCAKGSWGKERWLKHIKNRGIIAKLYIVNFSNELENFVKVGVTISTLENRFSSIPYNYEVIRVVEGKPEEIWDLERSLLNKYNEYQYIPSQYFCGNTECFTTDTINLLKNESI